jgi:hypothetical protein
MVSQIQEMNNSPCHTTSLILVFDAFVEGTEKTKPNLLDGAGHCAMGWSQQFRHGSGNCHSSGDKVPGPKTLRAR